MKRRTVNNMVKATAMIMDKGYDRQTANEIAIGIFDTMEQLKNGMSAEWYIEKIREYDPALVPPKKEGTR